MDTRLVHVGAGLLEENVVKISLCAAGVAALCLVAWLVNQFDLDTFKKSTLYSYGKFAYVSVIKPHSGQSDHGQQSALESFYATQASVYDVTRSRLLQGREDMLGLVAAQLQHRAEKGDFATRKPIWVDVGGGTGYNIETMDKFRSVPNGFEHVYLVDFSPSLCDVARQRFQRLGWENVSVVCEDARAFRLPQKYNTLEDGVEIAATSDVVTMSYSLSMIPDYYSVIDSISILLDNSGVVAVVDFYVQSIVDVSSRNYTGGAFNRHVNWLGRVFWRAWFDFDRVSLEGARRDFLEYRFGTIASASLRNYLLGGIPYYLFIGRKQNSTTQPQHELEELNASLTESPYLSPMAFRQNVAKQADESAAMLSKACEAAVVNLAANLPLPSTFYQNHQWRIYYDDLLSKHTQFKDEYIYAFNWEDPRVDRRLLDIKSDDVILAITSAGDNVLDYLLEGPRRLHAVDLNPNQNHLLELKAASLTALDYSDVWKIFGEGKHADFRELLIKKLSPHLSSQALQYWLEHTSSFTSRYGLYESGGSRHAIRLCRWLMRLSGLRDEVAKLVSADTLNEQREIWPGIRSVLLSWPLHSVVVGTEWFAWKAFGVPPAQRQLIQTDYLELTKQPAKTKSLVSGEAMWQYVVDTLDPVAKSTLLSTDNYFYALCLQGNYSKKSHPRYLDEKSYSKLSRSNAFDGLRIHTDSINEVIARIAPSTLSVAVIMDSMDWFDPSTDAGKTQVAALNRVLKTGGRVLLRSAGLKPWYIHVFEQTGFSCKCVGKRTPGSCMDRVNMYASTWLCTKTTEVAEAGTKPFRSMSGGALEKLRI